jgi:hypothetical protein
MWHAYYFVGLKDTSALLSCSKESPAAPVQQNSSRQILLALQLSAHVFPKFPPQVQFKFHKQLMGGFFIKHFALQIYLANVSILGDPKFDQHNISRWEDFLLNTRLYKCMWPVSQF